MLQLSSSLCKTERDQKKMIDFHRLISSFRYAGEGFKFAFRNDQNFIVHLIAAVLVILLGLYFQVSKFEMIALSIMIVLVLVTEMINTSIEKMVDLITTDHHPSAKFAKDVASAMVLLAAVSAVIVGIIVFYPYIFFF